MPEPLIVAGISITVKAFKALAVIYAAACGLD